MYKVQRVPRSKPCRSQEARRELETLRPTELPDEGLIDEPLWGFPDPGRWRLLGDVLTVLFFVAFSVHEGANMSASYPVCARSVLKHLPLLKSKEADEASADKRVSSWEP
ncbi:unnamed protein product [Arctogadus glacialis]